MIFGQVLPRLSNGDLIQILLIGPAKIDGDLLYASADQEEIRA